MDWTQKKHTEFIESVNKDLSGTDGHARRIFAADATEYVKSGGNRDNLTEQVLNEFKERKKTFEDNSDKIKNNLNEGLKNGGLIPGTIESLNLDPKDENDRHNPDDPNYTVLVLSSPYDEQVNETMHYFSRATEDGADFSNELSQGFLAKFTIYQGLGQALHGRARSNIEADAKATNTDGTRHENGHTTYDTLVTYASNHVKRASDGFTALKMLQDAQKSGVPEDIESTINSLETMAKARDLRIGYGPDQSNTNHGLVHDTSSTIRQIINMAKNDQLPENFANMNLLEITEEAKNIATETRPDYETFNKMAVAHDIVRNEFEKTKPNEDIEFNNLTKLQSTEGLDEIVIKMTERFNDALKNTHGLNNEAVTINQDNVSDIINNHVKRFEYEPQNNFENEQQNNKVVISSSDQYEHYDGDSGLLSEAVEAGVGCDSNLVAQAQAQQVTLNQELNPRVENLPQPT